MTGDLITRLRGREFRSIGVQLGHRYAGSPICLPDGTSEPPDEPDVYVPSTWPGCRAPHAWLPDGSSTLDHFGHGFVLVATATADPAPMVRAASALGVPLRCCASTVPPSSGSMRRRWCSFDLTATWRGAERVRPTTRSRCWTASVAPARSTTEEFEESAQLRRENAERAPTSSWTEELLRHRPQPVGAVGVERPGLDAVGWSARSASFGTS